MDVEGQLEVSVGLTRAILETLRGLGVTNTDALLEEAGIEARLLDKPENRVPF